MINNINKLIFVDFLILIFFASFFYSANAQCGCMSSISVGSLSPNIGTLNNGTLKIGYLNLNLTTNYTYGNTYYKGTTLAPPDAVKEFYNINSTLYSSYGVSNRVSLDLALSYIWKTYIDAPPFIFQKSGLGNIALLGKYNLLFLPNSNFELTLGMGGKIPMQKVTDTTYIYLQPSNGAFSAIHYLFIHKGFKRIPLNFYFVNQGEYYANNDANYQVGTTFITSLFTSYLITDKIYGAVEIRNEYKLHDINNNHKNFDSGFNNIILSPQISLSSKDYYLTLKYDFLAYKNFNGLQATKNYSISLNFGYEFEL
jgi:hypothetical protein